eukprot:g20286.t1
MNPIRQALRVGRRFSSRATARSTAATASNHRGLPSRRDLSTAPGRWSKRTGDPLPANGRREIKASTSASGAVSGPESGLALGAEAVRRWNGGGGGGGVSSPGEGGRGERSGANAPAPPQSARYHGASRRGQSSAGLPNARRSPPEASCSRGRGEKEVGGNDARPGWRGEFTGKAKRVGGQGARGAQSSSRSGEGGLDRTTSPAPTLAPAAAATASVATSSLKLEQASIMRRLKQAKTRRDGEEAKRILEDALAQEDAAELVDVFVFSAAVGAFAKAGRWEDALGVLGTMRERGVRPNEFTYNQAISACGNGGAWQWAVYLLKAMPTVGLLPDVVSYNAAIGACARAGQSEVAVVLLREMAGSEAEGRGRLAPNELTYNTVLSALAPPPPPPTTSGGGAASNWKLAVGLLEEMREKRVALGPESYALSVAACVAGGQAGVAVGLLRRMRKDRITPGLGTYNAVMTACRKAGEWELAVGLLEEVKEADGVAADSVTYAEVVEACRKGGQSDLAADLSRESQEARRARVVEESAR